MPYQPQRKENDRDVCYRPPAQKRWPPTNSVLATSSFLLLVVWPGAPSSVLAPFVAMASNRNGSKSGSPNCLLCGPTISNCAPSRVVATVFHGSPQTFPFSPPFAVTQSAIGGKKQHPQRIFGPGIDRQEFPSWTGTCRNISFCTFHRRVRSAPKQASINISKYCSPQFSADFPTSDIRKGVKPAARLLKHSTSLTMKGE